MIGPRRYADGGGFGGRTSGGSSEGSVSSGNFEDGVSGGGFEGDTNGEKFEGGASGGNFEGRSAVGAGELRQGEAAAMTVQAAWRLAAKQLQPRIGDAEEARFTAELLVRSALGWDRTALFLRGDEPLPQAAAVRLAEWLERRLAGEPTQYILGEQEFYGRAYTVTPAVLIPRPETELLVERVLAEAERLWPADGTRRSDRRGGGEGEGALTVADIGTGSGAIAVTLAAERADWRVMAVDLSADALAVARANAERLGVAARLSWRQGDLLAPLEADGLVPDVLVSNPPYIESQTVDTLAEEVREHEPRLALDGGPDGLDCYRRMIAAMGRWPRVPALVGFEVGAGQAREVAEMLRQTGLWADVSIVTDYAGIERHVIGVGL